MPKRMIELKLKIISKDSFRFFCAVCTVYLFFGLWINSAKLKSRRIIEWIFDYCIKIIVILTLRISIILENCCIWANLIIDVAVRICKNFFSLSRFKFQIEFFHNSKTILCTTSDFPAINIAINFCIKPDRIH